MSFPNLFSPIRLRDVEIKNRVFLAAHGTGMAEGGLMTDAQLAYYEARASRDIGLLFTEAHHVVPLDGIVYPTCTVATDDCIPKLAQLADLCHRHDVRFFGQLFHEGRSALSLRDGVREVTIGPSPVGDERHHNVPRAMTTDMIDEMVSYFAVGAARMVEAGADGIEVLVGMGYLHAQFLSPHINLRKDSYGGSPEGRRRFLAETLAAIRDAVGPDPVIGFRIVPQDDDPDGLDLADSIDHCVALADAGLSDYVNVAVGNTSTLASVPAIVPSMYFPTGASLPAARAVRERVSLPVLTAGRINQPQDAERAIADGDTDMVGMVRAFIADHEFASKAKAGRADEIRACIGCNQACIGHRATGHAVSCIQHPLTSRETKFTITRAERPKEVLVIGGGPAGMKCAVVAAERGHRVTIVERAARLGGQALLAERLPGRSEFGGLTTNLLSEIERYGVQVECRTEATTNMIDDRSPDAVIVATGATPYIPDPAWFEGAHVVTAWDVLDGSAQPGRNVVVADWRCDWIGPGVAEALRVDRKCRVRLAVNGEGVGQTVQSYVRYQLAGRLHRVGVEVVPYTRLIGADADTVYLQHVVTGEPVLLEDVDTLVLAYGHQSDVTLLDELMDERSSDVEVYGVGDCLSPRTAEEAILEGFEVGMRL